MRLITLDITNVFVLGRLFLVNLLLGSLQSSFSFLSPFVASLPDCCHRKPNYFAAACSSVGQGVLCFLHFKVHCMINSSIIR